MTPDLPDKLRRLADYLKSLRKVPVCGTHMALVPPPMESEVLREAANTLEAQAREIAQTERIAEEMRSIVQAQEKKLAWLRESCKTLIEFYDGHMAMEKKAVELAKAALTSTLAEKPE